jgi:hypothetical protein
MNRNKQWNTARAMHRVTLLFVTVTSLGFMSSCSKKKPTEAACHCECLGDPNCDRIYDTEDWKIAYEVAFINREPIPDPDESCPVITTDVNCDGITNVLDVVTFVDVVFRDVDPSDAFCEPCADL